MSDEKAARKNLKQYIKKCHTGSCPRQDISDEEKNAPFTWYDEGDTSLPSTDDVYAYRLPTQNNENYTDDSDSSSTFTSSNQSYDSSSSYSDSSDFSSHNSYDSSSTSSCSNSSCSTCDPTCSSEDCTSTLTSTSSSHDESIDNSE